MKMNVIKMFKKYIWKKIYAHRESRYRMIFESIYRKAYDNQNRLILSILQNEALIRQGISRDTRQYQIAQQLHQVIHIEEIVDNDRFAYRERMGRHNDGGYVVYNQLTENKILYSFGIADDVSFEKDLTERGYQCYMYDHTIDRLPYETQAFHWHKIGLAGSVETDDLKFLETLITENGHTNERHMFLKLDIEGAEWDFFEHVPRDILDQFDQIVIELHGILRPAFLGKTLSGINKLRESHAIIHIHANNGTSIWVNDDLVTPNVIEITLIHRGLAKLHDNTVVFPIAGLDEPTIAYSEDVCLGRWNTTISK